ncbi:MAG: arylsulfatase [Mangrovicoccus sp.]|nr:arylsulfatase [Mangrovicoccus sp.]
MKPVRSVLARSFPAAVLLCLGTLLAPPLAADDRPNIVVILADDLGWADVGFHGSDIATPTLDDLAASGAELAQFYAQPMCTPTRAALMTGRYPFRYGLQTAVIPSGGLYGLPLDEFLLPQALEAAGYQTAIIGKWHLGHFDPAYWPGNRGFELSYGPLIGEIDHFDHDSHGVRDWYRDGAPLTEDGYDTTLFADAAVDLIETRDRDRPLFLYLAFTAPHTPYQAPEAELARYEGIADPLRRAYAGQITAMDSAIGRVLEAIDTAGMRDNTLIVFASDNGGTRSAMFAGEGKVTGEIPPDNGPFRDGKGSVYEGGTRVVALANWPGRIAPGKVDGIVHMVDLFPTLTGLAAADSRGPAALDGIDVWETIRSGAPSPRTGIVYNIEPYRAAVREGDMKLVWTTLLPPSVELFDLGRDPAEAVNLATSDPATVARLQTQVLDLAGQAVPPAFMLELVRLGLSVAPAFPELGGNLD